MTTRKSQIQKLVTAFIGDNNEPTFNVLTSEKMDMVKALNWYAQNSNSEKSKEYALRWARANMPEIYPSLKGQKDWRFGSYGFVLRMAERGFVLTNDQVNKIKAELRLVAAHSAERVSKAAFKDPHPYASAATQSFDADLDRILANGKATMQYGVDPKDTQAIIKSCTKGLLDIHHNPEGYRDSIIKPLRKFYEEVKASLTATTKQVMKQKELVVKRPKKSNASNVRCKVGNHDGMRGLDPSVLIGANQALIYDTAKRRLTLLVAMNESGFEVTGTTIKGFDVEKSTARHIRKPELMIEAFRNKTISGMIKYMMGLRAAELKVASGRTNDDMMILKVA